MTTQDTEADLEFSRRKLLAAAGFSGGALVAASLVGTGDAVAAVPARSPADPATPPVAGLHLQFGSDASSEVVVSWHTLQTVQNPRVLIGLLDGKLEQTVVAKLASYNDAKSNKMVYAYHARIGRLKPDTAYLYSAIHDGAKPEFGTFRTSPRGRTAFTFTSFGDQGTPTLGKKFVPPEGVKLASAVFVNDNLGSPAAGDTTLGVERLQPLFHLFKATSATPISLKIGCGPGGISGRTILAAPATGHGCRPPATTRTNSATDRSAIRPIRRISRCRTHPARPI